MTKKEVYQDGIWKYGPITALFLLEKNKAVENYEECKIILEVIREHYKNYDIKWPTEFNDYAIEEMRSAFWKFGLSGDITLGNIPFYAEEIEKDLLKSLA